MRMNAALAETAIDHACVAVIQLQDCIQVRVLVILDTAAGCAHTQAANQHTEGETPPGCWEALWDLWDDRAVYRKTPRRNTGRV